MELCRVASATFGGGSGHLRGDTGTIVIAALDLATAASLEQDEVLRRLDSSVAGLTGDEARRRSGAFGPNEVGAKRTTAFDILLRQLANPFLILLVSTAVLAFFLGDRSDALIILAIIALSVGLSFVNEYRSEQAVADLRARVRREAVVAATESPRPFRSPISSRATWSSSPSAASYRPTSGCSTFTISSATKPH